MLAQDGGGRGETSLGVTCDPSGYVRLIFKHASLQMIWTKNSL